MKGLFITFEGTEGCGKSTQVSLLAERLRGMGLLVRPIREPGGTPIGEEIRHTLKHSHQNHSMTPEAELLLMNASRAQLVREIIRPALAAGEIVLCDRFYDSTIAYQGYGRELNLAMVRQVVDLAVGNTRPDITLLFQVSPEVSNARRLARQPNLPLDIKRDRFEEADHAFFDRVALGFKAVAETEPNRVRVIDANGTVEDVRKDVWSRIQHLLARR